MIPVAGLDPSLTATGLATALDVMTLHSDPTGQGVRARALRVHDLAARVCAQVAEGSLVVIEAPSLGQRRQGGEHQRAGLWWQLAIALELQHGCRVLEVAPATLKKFATGRGNATKPDMRVALLQRTGRDLRDDNQVDAFWLRQVGLHLIGDAAAVALPKDHLACLAALDIPTLPEAS